MTSMPEDGDLEQRHAEQETVVADVSDEAVTASEDDQLDKEDELDIADELLRLEEEETGVRSGARVGAEARAGANDQDDFVEEEEAGMNGGLQDLEPNGEIETPLEAIDALPLGRDTVANEDQPSVDDKSSIPDDTPSIQNSGISTPRSDALLSQKSASYTASTPPRRPFDLRFQSRLSSSMLISPRASSPAFLHSRQSSLASVGIQSNASDAGDSTAPWEVIRWTRFGKITNQAFSEIGRRNFGSPTCLAVTDNIVIGTSKGMVLIFDHHQVLKAIIGSGTKALESGAVSALAISADHSTVAAGHATGNIFTWEIARSSRPFLHIPPMDTSQLVNRRNDGHIDGSTVLHLGFLGFRRTALVSADDCGMAFSHLATRGTGSLGRTVKTARILGRYPDLISRASKPTKKSSVLAFAPLPLGNVDQRTDALGLVAMLTPYLLVIVSTTPIAQTQHKAARPKEVSAHSAMTAALAWFPAIKLKGSDMATSKPKLVYAWSDVLTVLDIHEVVSTVPEEAEKPPELQFIPRSRFKAEEAIVAIQWLSRSVMAVLTITQQLLIIEDVTMKVTDAFDLLPKDIYHLDVYSRQLRSVVEHLDDEDTSLHGVVADAFHMSFRAYKGRLYLLGFKNVWWGSLTNWADRLLAMMDAGDFIGAIRLATAYFAGTGEKLTIGLPEDDAHRAGLVREKLIEMMDASLRYAFGKNQVARTVQLDDEQLKDLAEACITACLSLDDRDFLFEDVFPWYDDHGDGAIFVDVLEPHILDGTISSLPPPVIKTLINHFKTTHSASNLEEIICLLDPNTMDIHQVTSLCKENNLYDAYIYVWNTAIQDYVDPLRELIELAYSSDQDSPVMHAGKTNGVTSISEITPQSIPHKMFAYLSFILTGRVYPTGTLLDEPVVSKAKLQLYEFLFSGTSAETLRDAEMTESYPSLRRILSYDTASFMSALNEAFEDTFLNEDEMMNGSTSDYFGVKIYTRQYIVQILLAVMSSGFDARDSIYLDMFIGRNLPKYPQYMLLSGSDLQDTFMRLCHYDDPALQDDAQLSVEYLLTAYHPPDILQLVPVLQRARFYRVLKSLFRQEHRYADLIAAYFDDANDKASVFETIQAVFHDNFELVAQQRKEVEHVVKLHALDLLDIDIAATASTIEEVLPDLHNHFIKITNDDISRQYQYLKALLEPDERPVPTESHTSHEIIELYVRRMCQYNPLHVADYVRSIQEDDLELDAVISTMEFSGVTDAAIILEARKGQVRNAMDRLVKHIQILQTVLEGAVNGAKDSPDETATDEAVDDLLTSIDRYIGIGIWICQGQKLKPTMKSPRRTAARQPLGFEEGLWLDLLVCVVGAAQHVSPEIDTDADADTPIQQRVQDSLRGIVQKVFTALLSSTTSSREAARSGNDYAFLRILRGFLTRAAETMPTLSELRGVIASIFSAYAYEEALLTLSNSMLDKDLFVHVDEVDKLRRVGWRPRGQICEICRRRVWGPGTGLKIWDAWQESEGSRKAQRRFESEPTLSVEESYDDRGKGKASMPVTPTTTTEDEAQNGSDDTKQSAERIIVFSCRHIYHERCLRQNQAELQEGEHDIQSDQVGTHDHAPLTCPSCP